MVPLLAIIFPNQLFEQSWTIIVLPKWVLIMDVFISPFEKSILFHLWLLSKFSLAKLFLPMAGDDNDTVVLKF